MKLLKLFLDKIFHKFEKYGLYFVSAVIIIVLFLLTFFFKADILLDKILTYFLIDKQNSFTTVSAIFIGAYFSILGFLASTKPESVVAKLSKSNLNKLFSFLFTAMFWSFIYLFLTFFIYNYDRLDEMRYFALFVLTALILMIVSSVRFAFYSFFIIKSDVKRIHQEINDSKEDKERTQAILSDLESFLKDQDNLNAKLRNEKLREHFKNKEK